MKKGSRHTTLTIEKISRSKLGHIPSIETRRKISEANKGRFLGAKRHPLSEEARLKISLSNKGKRLGIKHTPEAIKKIKDARAKQVITEETKKKMSLAKKGRKQSVEHINNKTKSRMKFYDLFGRKTATHIRIRMSKAYKEWRTKVFTKDNYTCLDCGDKSRKGHAVILQADHIKPFAFFPELRFDVSNGRTLCIDCHRKTDTYGRNKLAKIYTNA